MEEKWSTEAESLEGGEVGGETPDDHPMNALMEEALNFETPKRGQIVDGDDHADVVDRAVRDRLDGAVGQRPAAEEPDVPGRGGGEGFVEGQGRVVHGA